MMQTCSVGEEWRFLKMLTHTSTSCLCRGATEVSDRYCSRLSIAAMPYLSCSRNRRREQEEEKKDEEGGEKWRRKRRGRK